MGLDVRPSCLIKLIYLTLADEDTNSILTDGANRAIQGNMTLQVMQPGVSGGSPVVANFVTNASGATWVLNLQRKQESTPGGQTCN